MHEHSICGADLPVQDRLVLRATLRLFDGSAHRWRYVEEPADADVVLFVSSRDAGTHAATSLAEQTGLPLRIALAPALSAPHPDGMGIVMPLRSRELSVVLASLSKRLLQLQKQRSSATPEVRRATDSAAVLAELTSAASIAKRLPLNLRIGCSVVLAIEQDDAQRLAGGLVWRSASLGNVHELCAQVAAGAPLELLERAPDSTPWAGPFMTGTLSQLVWALTAYERQPRAAMPMTDHARFALRRWPDFGALPATAVQVHVAALLVRRRLTLSQLMALADVDRAQAIAVLNACHWMKLLSTDALAETAPSSGPGLTGQLRGRLGEKGLGGLVRSIRAALQGVVAKSPP